MKKNNKGFTLIELLAVIVVLAIIMVIATTQINGTIRKSRANSFYESVQMIEKNADMVCAQDTNIDAESLMGMSDITSDDEDLQIEVSPGTSEDSNASVTVTAKDGGQFDNVDLTDYYHAGESGNGDKVKNSITAVAANSMKFTAECPVATDSTD